MSGEEIIRGLEEALAHARGETLTEAEQHVMRHALGLNRIKAVDRNHYIAFRGGPEDAIWSGLTARGLAALVREGDWYRSYAVTPAGRVLIAREASHD